MICRNCLLLLYQNQGEKSKKRTKSEMKINSIIRDFAYFKWASLVHVLCNNCVSNIGDGSGCPKQCKKLQNSALHLTLAQSKVLYLLAHCFPQRLRYLDDNRHNPVHPACAAGTLSKCLLFCIHTGPESASFKDSQGKISIHGEKYHRPESVHASGDLGNCAIGYALGAGFDLVNIRLLQGLSARYCNLKRGSISTMKV